MPKRYGGKGGGFLLVLKQILSYTEEKKLNYILL